MDENFVDIVDDVIEMKHNKNNAELSSSAAHMLREMHEEDKEDLDRGSSWKARRWLYTELAYCKEDAEYDEKNRLHAENEKRLAWEEEYERRMSKWRDSEYNEDLDAVLEMDAEKYDERYGNSHFVELGECYERSIEYLGKETFEIPKSLFTDLIKAHCGTYNLDDPAREYRITMALCDMLMAIVKSTGTT